MGGRIWAESTLGVGSSFRVLLWFDLGPSDPPSAAGDGLFPATPGPSMPDDSREDIPAPEPEPPPADVSPPPETPPFRDLNAAEATAMLRHFQALLSASDGEAGKYFDSNRIPLQGLLGRETVERLKETLRGFDFDEALEILKQATESQKP